MKKSGGKFWSASFGKIGTGRWSARSGGGFVPPPPSPPQITSLGVGNQDGGFARIWSTITRNATVSGAVSESDTLWYLDDSPMQGQNQAGMYVDPSMDLGQLAVTYSVTGAGGTDAAFSLPVQVRYPVPIAAGAIPAITGAVGDLIDMDVASAFYDGNPNNAQNASLVYTISAGSLPAGLTLVGSQISGTLTSAVTGQSFTVRAANSGGAATVSSTATVTGGESGTILWNQDFNSGTGIPANMTTNDPDLVGTINPTYVYAETGHTNLFFSPGALIVESPPNVISWGEIIREVDISSVATGENIEIRIACAFKKMTSTGLTGTVLYLWLDGSGVQIGTTVTLVSNNTPTSSYKTLYDGSVTVPKPAGAAKVRIRFRNSVWTSIGFILSHASVRTPAAVVVPTIQSATITGSGKIGDVHTVDYNVTPAGTSVSFNFLRDGVSIGAPNVATFTPTTAEDLTTLGCILTPVGGSPYNAQTIAITRKIPNITAAPTITPKSATAGDTLTFTAGAADNGATTAVEVLRDDVQIYSGAVGGTITSAVAGNYQVRASYTNSGGTVTQTDSAVVSASVAGLPIIVYDNSFATDRTADFLAGTAALSHDPSLTYPLEGNGAMLVGAVGDNFGYRLMEFPAEAGKSYEIFTRSKITGTGTNVGRGYFNFLDAAGNSLYNVWNTLLGDWQPQLPVAPAGTVKMQFKFEVRGIILEGTTRRLEIHRVQCADITASGPSPLFNNDLPVVVSPYAYVGVETVGIDFGVSFSGTKTGWVYDGPEPHRWVGSTLYITPDAVIAPTQTRYVYALNGPLQAKGGAILRLNVKATPETLALATSPALLTDAPEVNRPMMMRRPQSYVTGGVEPFTMTLLSKPSWVVASPDNTKFTGIAPATPQALANISVRVTDKRGDFVDVNMPVEVVALRSRTPFVTIAPTTDLKTAIGASKGAGRVIQLQAGEYTMGNWYGFLVAPPDNPMIIRGVGNATIMHGGCYANKCEGLIFENMACRFSAQPDVEGDAVLSATGSYNRYYDMDCEGWTVNVADIPPTSWIRPTETVTYAHLGSVALGGVGSVMDNITVRKLHTGFGIAKGTDVTLCNANITQIRDDIFTFSQTTGCVVHNVSGGTFDGNYDQGEHRDLAQFMGDNSPGIKDAWIRNVFLSSRDAGIAGSYGGNQGLFAENDGFATGTKNANFGYTHDRSNLRFLVQDSVFLPGSNYGIYLKAHVGTVIKQVVAINHPDQTTGSVAALSNAGSNDATLTGIIHEGAGFNQSPTITLARNLLILTDSASINVGVTAIFPNWSNTGLAYEDPRDAVKAGQPASAARFWIDPSSAWGIANPTKGPAWLRTGAAT